MESTTLSHNLRRIRDARKLSQAELAQRSNLSRVAYGSIESGTATPKVDTLLRIAEALDVKLQDLLAPVRVLTAVRFRARKTMTSRQQVLVEVSRWLENYAELEQLLDDRVAYAFAKIPRGLSGKRGPARIRAAAQSARTALRLNSDASIRDICGLLEERGGIKVYPLNLASDTFFGLSVAGEDGGPAIVVNVWDRISVERWVFTAAHELGHLLLHLNSYDIEETNEDDAQEKEADQFASHFLMPDDVFLNEWKEARGLSLIDRVIKVKHIFRVSYRTVLYRLSEDKAYGKDIWRQFQVAHYQRYGHGLNKSDEPQPLPPDHFQATMVEPRAADEPRRITSEEFMEDRLSRLVRAAIEKEAVSVGRAAEILDVELQEMRDRITSWVA